MPDIYNIEGTALTDSGLPAVGRTVRIHNRTTWELIRTLTTDSSGQFKTIISNNSPVTVIILPESGDQSNAQIWDNVVPKYDSTLSVENDIGFPGAEGFGVGICPNALLPANFSPMLGFNDKSSPNYGNYTYAPDGSVMCWIPAFYYKWGTGSNGLALNDCDIKSVNLFVDEAEANASGYALHRAFIDGGQIQPGFFIDKYLNCKHPTLANASSLPLQNPLYAYSGAHSFSSVNAAISNNLAGAVDLAKLRGVGFFANSIFQTRAIFMLSYAHGRASTSTTYCGWYGAPHNYPKGNVSGGSVFVSSPIDNNLRGWAAASTSYILTGGYSRMELVTHNGQKCGVTDVTGNLWTVAPGLTVLENDFKILKESFSMKNGTSGTTLATDFWFTTPYDSLGATLSDFGTTAGDVYATAGTQIFNEQTDRNSTEYRLTSIGVYKAGNFSTTNTFTLGGGLYRHKVNQVAPIEGGTFSTHSYYGVGSVYLYFWSTASYTDIGLRSAFYIL